MFKKMREILFRGKRIDNGEWVEGFYVHIPCGRFMCDEHLIQTVDADGRIGQLYTIYESTLGQFTGLTDKNDKNDKKIFEGDIVDIIDETEYGVIEWLDDEAMFACHVSGHCSCLDSCPKYAISVVGNIHDNPELLKEAPNV